jgi:serine protease
MSRRYLRNTALALTVCAAGLLTSGATLASANMIPMPTLPGEIQHQRQIWAQHVFAPVGKLQPPAPPCPESGMLPAPLSNCGAPEFPATTLPYPGNMAYWGGHVQTSPHVYVVYWGWGEKGAFPASQPCTAEKLVEGSTTATLRCDPDGAGKYMADWVYQLGGTQWAGVQDQYYQTATDPSGKTYNQYVTNPSNQLGGMWVDDQNSIAGLSKTSATNAAGPTNTYTDLAAEAARAVAHFHITDLANASIVIAQPANYSDPNALSTGYCAFHDYTYPSVASGIYNGITKGISYTNMPYALSINSSGTNVCGENAVNPGPSGKLDGFSVVLGHEIEETVTDPGAEDIIGSGTSTNNLGGWYDSIDANENGDKCAWVGESLGLPGEPTVTPIPGALNDIKGNHGSTFAVQSLWSNQAAAGTGYCAGAGNDVPQPIPAQ